VCDHETRPSREASERARHRSQLDCRLMPVCLPLVSLADGTFVAHCHALRPALLRAVADALRGIIRFSSHQAAARVMGLLDGREFGGAIVGMSALPRTKKRQWLDKNGSRYKQSALSSEGAVIRD
jgi:hypothetical protein